jgi:hypothetical protein
MVYQPRSGLNWKTIPDNCKEKSYREGDSSLLCVAIGMTTFFAGLELEVVAVEPTTLNP